MAGTIGIGFSIGATVAASVAGAFQTVETRLNKTRAALAASAKEAKAFSRAVELRGQRDSLAAQVRASGGEDAKAVRALAAVSAKYREAKAAALAYGGSVRTWSAQQAIANQRLALTSQRMAALDGLKAQRGVRRDLVGQAVGLGASAMAYGAPLKVGLEFEQGMSRVKAIAGASTEELQAMTAQARELGATTVWSAKEASEGMTFLSMAGFNAKQTMAAMPGMLNLASAGAVDLGTTADIASNILTGFGFEAEKMNYVGDVLAKTFTRSNTTLQSLGESFKYCGPAASKAGQSFEQTAAMIGALGNAGIQGSEAGTGLNAIMSRMASPPKAAATALRKLNISIADANGNMRPMSDIMLEISQKTQNMGEVQRLAYAKALFGVNHFAKGLVLMSAAADGSLQKLANGLYEEGYATRVAKEQTDNLSGDLKALNSAYEEVGITAYNVVLPALRAITQGAIGWMQSAGAWMKAHPQLTQAIMVTVGGLIAFKAVAIAGALGMSLVKTAMLSTTLAMNAGRAAMLAYTLATSAGARAQLVSAAVTKASSVAMAGWSAITKTVTAGQWLLNAALTANPIGLVVAAVAGLVAIMVTLYNTCEPVRVVFDKFFGWLAEKFPSVAKVFSAIGSGVKAVGRFFGFGGGDADKPAEAAPTSTQATAPAPLAAVTPPPVAAMPPTAAQAYPQLAVGDDEAGEDDEDNIAVLTAPSKPKPAQRKARSPSGAAGNGEAAAPQAAPQVNFTMQFQVEGMPAADFAQGVIKAVESNKDKLERMLTDIVHKQMRVAYGS